MKWRWGIIVGAGAALVAGAGWLVRREGARPSSLDDARYILLTTFKEDGSRASTPVWFARGEDGVLQVTTPADSWKVKRIRRDPRVELTPCDVRGGIEDGLEPQAGVARIARGEGAEAVAEAIRDRYGWQHRIAGAAESIRHRRRGDAELEWVGLRIVLTERLGEPGAG